MRRAISDHDRPDSSLHRDFSPAPKRLSEPIADAAPPLYHASEVFEGDASCIVLMVLTVACRLNVDYLRPSFRYVLWPASTPGWGCPAQAGCKARGGVQNSSE